MKNSGGFIFAYAKIKNVSLPLLIFTVSFILNFGIPYAYYLYVTRYRRRTFDPHRAINRYFSGMVGDAVCAPLLNTFLFLTYQGLPLPLHPSLIMSSLITGWLITFLLHLTQAKMKMTNWSMPQPWRWTFPGKYHMFSATIQFGFLTFSAYALGHNWALIFAQPQRLLYLLFASIFVLVFNLTFTKDTLLPALNESPADDTSAFSENPKR